MRKKVIPLLMCAVLANCSGSDSGSSSDSNSAADSGSTAGSGNGGTAVQLPVVTDYILESTDTVLTSTSQRLENLSIEAFFEQSFTLLNEREIENAISDGLFDSITTSTPELTNISDEYTRQTGEIYQLILTLLDNYNRSELTPDQQVSYDVFKKDIGYKKAWVDNLSFDYPATYGFFGWPGSTETFFTQAFTFNTKEQAELYLTLLSQIQRRFSQIETLLDNRASEGIVEPAFTLQFSQNAVATMANLQPTATSYYQAFNTQLSGLNNIGLADKNELLTQAQQIVEQRVIPAYQSLFAKMADHLAQAPSAIGFGQFEGGKEFYKFTLNYFTNGDLTPEQVHQLGKDELSRIHQEMSVLFNQLGYPDESIAQSLSRANSEAPLIAAGEVKKTYEDLIEKAYLELPALFETIPQQEVIVVGGTSGGYYIAGADDGSRPGAFYANTSSSQPYTTMPTLAYHEAVPGHHLQIALANEINLPLFRRKMHFTSYIEGWALYAERLAKEENWYSGDVYGDLGRLQFEAMRAARLVVDTGIHYFGWTQTEANNFHLTNVGFNGSIARYSVWPGQATAYTIGMLKILELRQKAQTELADKFDLKEFHSVVLNNAAIPLDVLEVTVNRYIENKQ